MEGRADLVVDLPFPDAGAGRRLIDLCAAWLTLEGVGAGRLIDHPK